MPFIRFPDYLKGLYEDKSDRMKALYGSFEKFKKNALAVGAYKDWIESLRDKNLSHQEMKNVAQAMYQYGNVEVKNIHTQLALLCHQFNVELPAVAGCLTPAYWESFFGNKNLNRH